jgi:hypothetical protein
MELTLLMNVKFLALYAGVSESGRWNVAHSTADERELCEFGLVGWSVQMSPCAGKT